MIGIFPFYIPMLYSYGSILISLFRSFRLGAPGSPPPETSLQGPQHSIHHQVQGHELRMAVTPIAQEGAQQHWAKGRMAVAWKYGTTNWDVDDMGSKNMMCVWCIYGDRVDDDDDDDDDDGGGGGGDDGDGDGGDGDDGDGDGNDNILCKILGYWQMIGIDEKDWW